MIFEKLNTTKDQELKYLDTYKKRMQVKRYDLIFKPIVYVREYDFSKYKNIEKYGIEPKKYIYIGSHEQYSMNARNSKQANRSMKQKYDEFTDLFLKYLEYYINEIEPEKTREEVYEKLYYDFFYSNICYFYTESIEKARELETQALNEFKIKYSFSDEYILLNNASKDDSSVKIEIEDNQIKLISKKSRNGSRIQPINLSKVTQKLSNKDILTMTDEELYSIAYSYIGEKATIQGETIEITQDNFYKIFEELQKIKREN